eukprot:GHRQ01015748.1.p1 GENE.GHRQ01015748.1~~GHRQ01015748.1.p1  ORF type:complete len:186 (+),score=50.25 GHRQ01015748.1:362-919(+)
MPAYGEAAYWDQRYQREPTCFDWYQGFSGLEPILKRHVPMSANILHVGVGTSQLQAEMVQRGGYQRILNTDISSVVVQHMQDLHKGIPQLQYRTADARSMPEYKDGAFDAVLDKGTLDAVLCGQHAGDSATSMLDECSRCGMLQQHCCSTSDAAEPAQALTRLQPCSVSMLLPGRAVWVGRVVCL